MANLAAGRHDSLPAPVRGILGSRERHHQSEGGAASTAPIHRSPLTWQVQLAAMVAGGTAGAVGKTVTAPMARLTILYQVHGVGGHYHGVNVRAHSLWDALRHITRSEGLLSLWRGNGVTILHRVPYSAVNFWAYEWLTHAFLEARARAPGSPGEGKGRHGAGVLVAEDFSRRLAIGALSGGAACAAAYPLDLARTRLSVQLATGRQPPRMGALLMGVVRSEGVRGLYRGLAPTVASTGPTIALNYAVYESLRDWYLHRDGHKRAQPPTSVALAFGSTAGLLSSLVMYPLDLVRRRIQIQGQDRPGARETTWHAAVAIARKEGVRGFYHGFQAEAVKVAPGMAIAFCVYEGMKYALGIQDSTSLR